MYFLYCIHYFVYCILNNEFCILFNVYSIPILFYIDFQNSYFYFIFF
nr:MAG TPA_asm: hypothetical protein [Caudoviricetes sp.]